MCISVIDWKPVTVACQLSDTSIVDIYAGKGVAIIYAYTGMSKENTKSDGL